MFETITQLTRKPKIYEKTLPSFWEDDYISQNILENHLNSNSDIASRNMEFIKNSVTWITNICPVQTNQILLDIGCGPGIYAELFFKNGYQVTGIDFSQRSIRYAKTSARKNHLDITYLKQDYLNFNLSAKYDVITMIYCDYGALSTNDRMLLAKKIHQHLKPNGKFILDVFSVAKFNDVKESKTWEYSASNGFWSRSAYLELNRCIKYCTTVTLEQATVITEKKQEIHNIWTTYFDKDTLAEELSKVGFKNYKTFSDVKGTPYNKNNATLAMVVEK